MERWYEELLEILEEDAREGSGSAGSAARAIKSLRDHLSEVREALKPFATLVEAIECTTSHEYADTDEWDVKIGLLRAARTAYHR